jgi:hypothetical protein
MLPPLTFSATLTLLIAKLDASSSVMVPVPVEVAIVVGPVLMPESTTVNASVDSLIASFKIGTVIVLVVPVGEFAGKVKVPVVLV